MKRRKFIKNLGMIYGAGVTSLSLGGLPVKAFASPFLNVQSIDGKILIILQLKGGNDGLNTLVPYEDDRYYLKRPNLAIPKENVLTLNSTLGFHPSMQAMKNMFEEGNLAIIQNVGYEDQDRSHFRSTDIWLTASDADVYLHDGWIGRTLLRAYPDFPATVPEHPMAVELGAVQSLLLESQLGSLGVTFEDPWTFYQLVEGTSVDNDPVPNTLAGEELKFLRQVAAQSVQYAEVVKNSAEAGQNAVEYPDTWLGWQMQVIANLISGQLNTPVFIASHWGFDTHANQADEHATLLQDFSESVSAFMSDMKAQGLSDKIVLMTISEFGRRVAENGSRGTDHGAAAPLFVFGDSVNGGIYGDNPDLIHLDFNDDLFYQFDFRQIYATVLRSHLQMGHTETINILQREFDLLGFLDAPLGLRDAFPITYELSQNYPNPFNPSTKIKFSIPKAGKVKLTVYDVLGRKVAELANGYYQRGTYAVDFNANAQGRKLASGVYIYRIEAGTFSKSRKMMLVK